MDCQLLISQSFEWSARLHFYNTDRTGLVLELSDTVQCEPIPDPRHRLLVVATACNGSYKLGGRPISYDNSIIPQNRKGSHFRLLNEPISASNLRQDNHLFAQLDIVRNLQNKQKQVSAFIIANHIQISSLKLEYKNLYSSFCAKNAHTTKSHLPFITA